MLKILIKRLTTRREVRARARPQLERFCAVDGSTRVMIEADHEDDARYLCAEFGWHFIEMCDD